VYAEVLEVESHVDVDITWCHIFTLYRLIQRWKKHFITAYHLHSFSSYPNSPSLPIKTYRVVVTMAWRWLDDVIKWKRFWGMNWLFCCKEPRVKLDDVDDEYVLTLHLDRQYFTATATHDNTAGNILLNKRGKRLQQDISIRTF